MKKLLSKYIVVCVAVCLSALCIGCGKSGSKVMPKEQPEEEQTKVTLEPQTKDISLFYALPVEGEDSKYFSISGPGDMEIVKLVGTPLESDSYMPQGVIKANVEIRISRRFADGFHAWKDYPGLQLVILNEDHEKIATLDMSETDAKLIEKEFAKKLPAPVNVVFKETEFADSYKSIMTEATYYQLIGASIISEKEYQAEQTTRETSVTIGNSDNSSSDSYDIDDSDDDDSDNATTKSRWQKIKEKTKKKTRELKEKATEKIDEWLDKD